jgi:uncharacterized protein YsxB (DUF464 family)
MDRIARVTVSGHAGFDAYGYDIVCSSVSALVLTTINALEDYVGLSCELDVKDGFTSFSVDAIDEFTDIQAQALLHALEIGINGLCEEFGEFLSVTSEEEHA